MTRERALAHIRTLLGAERLLDERVDKGGVDEARRVVASVRAELASGGDELTAPISVAWMFIEQLEKRVG